MSLQLFSIRPIALAAPILLWGFGIAVPAARADDCLKAPMSGTPKGGHWYYHTDRAKGRKCWFLRAVGSSTQHASTTAPAARSGAVETAASASAGVAASTGARNNTQTLPSPTSGTTTPWPVTDEQEGAAPPNPAMRAPQSRTLVHTIVHEPAATPAVPMEASDPPTVATVKQQEADAGAAQNGVLNAAGATTTSSIKTTSSVWTLMEMVLVAALGLTVAGLLYRLVIKIAAMSGERIIMDHSALDWVRDDRHTYDVPLAWRPRGLVNERNTFVDDVDLSLAPAESGYAPRRPRQVDSELLREGGAPPIAAEHSERENRFAQLLRDLDQMLQSRKEA